MDIKSIIDIINATLNGDTDEESRLYTDEPIIQVASKMRGFLPEKCRKLREMSKFGYCKSSYEFYKQAKFMEDYEDDFEYKGNFFCYYPSYAEMNDNQLRGYFSWRTQVRHGEIKETSISFAFVYIYELINLIGVSTPEQGYETLKNFWEAYRKFTLYLDSYVPRWLSDFAVYYNLPKNPYLTNANDTFARQYTVLRDYEKYTSEEIFDVIQHLSTYNIEKSRFFKQYAEDTKRVAASVYVKMADYFKEHRKNTYCEKLLGKVFEFDYRMFQSAHFYDKKKYKNYEYAVNDITIYRCKKGQWSLESLWLAGARKNGDLGTLLRTIDRIMRQKYGFPYPLKDNGNATKMLIKMIEKTVDELLCQKAEEEKQKKRREVKIDTSLLSGIRKSAENTRDKLIVEEETDNNEPAEEIHAVKPSETVTEGNRESDSANDTGLDKTEYEFLRLFLYGGDYKSFVTANKLMLSILIDSVNDKLFDTFGDTVIVFDSDTPELIDDYIDELKGLIKQ